MAKAIGKTKKGASGVAGFFKDLGAVFARFGTAVAKGDLWVKLSLVWWGAGYLGRKQYVKALIMTALEAGVIYFSIAFAPQYVSKFATLGTTQMAHNLWAPPAARPYCHPHRQLHHFLCWYPENFLQNPLSAL